MHTTTAQLNICVSEEWTLYSRSIKYITHRSTVEHHIEHGRAPCVFADHQEFLDNKHYLSFVVVGCCWRLSHLLVALCCWWQALFLFLRLLSRFFGGHMHPSAWQWDSLSSPLISTAPFYSSKRKLTVSWSARLLSPTFLSRSRLHECKFKYNSLN
jgi:hypothetical protein